MCIVWLQLGAQLLLAVFCCAVLCCAAVKQTAQTKVLRALRRSALGPGTAPSGVVPRCSMKCPCSSLCALKMQIVMAMAMQVGLYEMLSPLLHAGVRDRRQQRLPQHQLHGQHCQHCHRILCEPPLPEQCRLKQSHLSSTYCCRLCASSAVDIHNTGHSIHCGWLACPWSEHNLHSVKC